MPGAERAVWRATQATELVNVQRHCLMLDGVYQCAAGEPVFVELPAPGNESMQALLHKITGRLVKLLTRRSIFVEENEGATCLTDSASVGDSCVPAAPDE